MATLADTYTTYDQVGTREDLADVIYNIAPTEAPFMQMIGRGVATQPKHEWQVDTLAAAAVNAQVEGDDQALDTAVPTERLSNYCQISSKVIRITGTAEATDKAGRRSELAYQVAKYGKELKRDMELTLTGNYAIEDGAFATARTTGSLEIWYQTNGDRTGTTCLSGTGNQPDQNKTVTDGGTTRALTESLIKTVIQAIWSQGGDPTVIMTGPFNKRAISGFTGGATRFDISEDKKLVAAIDVYVSDFGTHRVIPNRFSRDKTVHLLTPSMFKVCYLRSFRQFPLAKTGDAEKRELLAEYCLRSDEQKASGVIADLTTS